VEPGESATVLLLLANLFVLLVAYYVMKTVREPLVLLSGGAEGKSYASAVQATLLVGVVPAYGWVASRVSRARLVLVVILASTAVLEAFYAAAELGVPYLGFAFYVWVGIFSVASIATFWSYANDLYDRPAGERLFPVVAIGAVLGSPVGARIAERLFAAGVPPFHMLHVSAALLLVHLALYGVVEARARGARAAAPPVAPGHGGFALVLRSPYLRLVAAVVVLANLVNTVGEYVLGRLVLGAAEAAAASAGLGAAAYIGAFYGRYFLWVNVATVALQAFVVSRLAARLGMRGVLLALPLVALGAYALVAAGAALAVVRWAKTAENAVDYSVMNTGKQMLWLPTSREEKYVAKQAIDTFFVRAGDVLAAALVYAGARLGAGVAAFGAVNLAVILVWLAVLAALLRRHRALAAACP
jgi:AAA family ATP:ADP antiporter